MICNNLNKRLKLQYSVSKQRAFNLRINPSSRFFEMAGAGKSKYSKDSKEANPLLLPWLMAATAVSGCYKNYLNNEAGYRREGQKVRCPSSVAW